LALKPNEKLGDFVIVQEIGRGGMGAVYEAEQISLKRRVALKVLPDDLADNPRAIRRFHREVEAVAKLNQPGIVPVYCFAEERGVHFYAMELVHGRPVSELISETRHRLSSGAGASSFLSAYTPEQESPQPSEFRDLSTLVGADAKERASQTTTDDLEVGKRRKDDPAAALGPDYVRDVCEIIAQVGEAVDHAHRRRVVHRDIKPQNMLINDKGEVKITDFGLARYEGDLSLTEMGKAVGTPLYMSPEQVAGGNVGLDKRTDVYSLGASLYEMLTLRPPFTADSREAIYKQIMFDEPARPCQFNRALTRDLETIVLKAIEKDPALRYQSAQELADDLRRFLSHEPVWARPQGPLVRTVKWMRRNKAVTTVSALAAVLVITAVVGLTTHQRMQSRQRAQRLIRQALEARRQGDFRKAFKLCSTAQGLWPDSRDIQREIGRAEVQMVRAAKAEQLARQRQQADQRAREGLALYRRSGDLDEAVLAERAEVARLKETIKGYDPPEKKGGLWHREGELDRVVQEQQQLTIEAEAHLLGALQLDSQNLLAKAALADLYWERLTRASATKEWNQARRYEELVRVYDSEGRYAGRLEGHGTLQIRTDPSGAAATLCTYVEERPLLVSKHERTVGQTPVSPFTLPMGSYLLILKMPGYADTRCPVFIDREEYQTVDIELFKPDQVGEGFVYVPRGEFFVGSATPDDPADLIRETRLEGFFIGKHELTCQEYLAFLNDVAKTDPKRAMAHAPRGRFTYWILRDGQFVKDRKVRGPREGPNFPIHTICYHDALAYCKWRTQKENATYRLPTHIEWEKAARGVDGRLYPWGNHFDPVLCNMRHSKKTCIVEPVGTFPHDCSPYGAMDMAGNQTELCADPNAKPGWCMGKGATFFDPPRACRCAYKDPNDAHARHTQYSFRVLKELPARPDQ